MIRRVLVLDDEPMQLELVERSLSRDGFEVRGVTTVADMIPEAARFLPHVMLIDVNLPDAAGGRAIALARSAAPDAHLILYSAWEESKLRILALHHGVDGYISKSESVIAIGQRLLALDTSQKG